MRIKIASDIHGAYDELAASFDADDTAFLLGDFINILDYADFSGILAELVPMETIQAVVDLQQQGKKTEAKTLMNRTAAEIPDLFGQVARIADRCYGEVFEKMPCRAFVINGNVDFPDLLERNTNERVTFIKEFQRFEMGGRSVGFVAGIPHMPFSFGMPGETSQDEYARRLAELGPVDHLFVHPPPMIEELAYDVKAKRNEGGSEALLDYIKEYQPLTVHFGHIHQPQATQMTLGRTHLINVGCFRDRQSIAVLDLGE